MSLDEVHAMQRENEESRREMEGLRRRLEVATGDRGENVVPTFGA